jgi:hypothetical protein
VFSQTHEIKQYNEFISISNVDDVIYYNLYKNDSTQINLYNDNKGILLPTLNDNDLVSLNRHIYINKLSDGEYFIELKKENDNIEILNFTKSSKINTIESKINTNIKTECVSVQCSGYTESGSRCKRITKNCSGKCHQH